ncbi:MAG: 2-C-methyl-D-erythritol 4-phosphate cytidylyltransferase [Lachnospiraceae bacterium]|nr:2-C-methyl-D-erythritol 4-phosphate cytidylyltransferase [Lachnospiraceae bacterium]
MRSNVYGVILAGGKGTRMGNVEKPKQFMEIGDRPIIIHTIEKFIMNPEFEKILVLSPKQWIKHTEDLVRKYILDADRIQVIEGGVTRNETIMNAIAYIDGQKQLNEDTVIVTHDSVRPFLTHRIIEENIRYAKEYGACDTIIPATDTIVESKNNHFITNIPDRSTMYQGQTPQSFKAEHLRNIYQSLSEEEKEILTDACKILVMKGEKVHLVEGEESNIKITYPYDMRVAEALLGGI